MDPYGNLSNYFSETDIDFFQYQVIAVLDALKGNGGWSIDITDITEYQDEIVVTVENLKRGNLTAQVTHPFHIVKIPQSAKNVRFQEIDIPVWEYTLANAGTACQWRNINYNDEVIIISDNEELGNYISCSDANYRAIAGWERSGLLAGGAIFGVIRAILKYAGVTATVPANYIDSMPFHILAIFMFVGLCTYLVIHSKQKKA